MKTLVVLLALAAAASTIVPPDMSFDNIDLEQYNDKYRLENYVRCLANDTLIKECSDFEINIRERAPGIVVNICGDCSPIEKEAIRFLVYKVATYKGNTSDLALLMNKFDPSLINSRNFFIGVNEFETKQKLPKVPESIIAEYPSPCSD